MKKMIALILAVVLCFALAACGGTKDTAGKAEDSTPATAETAATEETTTPADTEAPADTETAETTEPDAPAETGDGDAALEAATVHLYIAASLENAFIDIIEMYKAVEPNVTVEYNADSSGTLLTQIEEAGGAGCDIFFSAAVKQVKTLDETDHLMMEGSRVDLLKNQLVVISGKGSGTAVTGLANIGDAASIALADGSVPVGKYTRQALVNAGLLESVDDVSAITTEEVSAALGGVEINECGNVSKVKEAVKEGSNEVGTVYYSDAYSVRDDVDIIEMVSTDLTGEILYPVCRVINPEADDPETAAADDFMAFLQTPEVLAVYENYMFIVNEG